MKNLKKYFIAALSLFFVSAEDKEYLITGVIESIRNDNYITLLLDDVPAADEYLIFNDNEIIGKVSSLRASGYINGKARYLAVYSVKDDSVKYLLKAGMNIYLKHPEKIYDKRTENDILREKPVYKPLIISNIDKREMIFIPSGKFLMGSSSGDYDEYPEHMVFVDNYYIDRLEVSNEDYKIYADKKAVPYPEYWKDKINSKGDFTDLYFSRLPVIISYIDAEKFAKWAGKRLPDEREWEKAARFPADASNVKSWSIYTWGTVFKDGISNTEEFWTSEIIGKNFKTLIKEKYGLSQLSKGLIPVELFEKEAQSYYGVVHMDGNVSEWTSSWYKAYPSNTRYDKKYGTQYKVIRGGAFNLGKEKSRVTDRKIGGFPDLYRDRIAGFRCVKNVTDNDRN